ncbi:non-ribosomal peptide synthetase, partial [Streptomyces sp. NPDC001970]
MTTHVSGLDAGREFWRGVLLGGGFAPVPRWVVDPVPGTAVCEVRVPGGVVAVLDGLADEVAVSPSSVLLAAHARVVAVLVGESEITTGYVATAGGRPLPCRLTTVAASWRELVRSAGGVVSELLVHQDFPVGDLRRELGSTGPLFESVFDASGSGADFVGDGDAVLRVGFVRRVDGLVLRLRYRTDVVDGDCAAR